MKRIVASVGMVTMGISGVSAYSPGLVGPEASKTWSVSATLRGFYDDNYAYGYSNRRERDSFGFNVAPSVQFNLPLEQTYLGLRYLYSGKYFEDRSKDAWDHSHQVDLRLTHAFSERYSIELTDSFVVAQEPELLDNGVPYRTEGDNIRNQARLLTGAQLTRQLGVQLGYNNVFWNYDMDNGTPARPSLSGLLDRVEHMIVGNLRWQALPETTALVGYNLGITHYTGDEQIAWAGPIRVMSEDRDNISHYLYAGVNHAFLRNASASLKLGATHIDYDNDRVNEDNWIPYVDVSANYAYARGGNVQIGFVHSFYATDVIAPLGTRITGSQESSTVYGLISHQITPKLVALANVRYQDSTFDGGLYGDQGDQFFSAGVNLTYQVNRFLSCEAGYNFDRLNSDIPGRSYDRNRVYIGITATY
ncbi:MAG: outer membrane beta-barrel protein [Verrucomicrobiota bacterium]|nr:outer membrane beta-barrel protein [Limisphaera sp.]MDW8381408.1 outer membrane beta-barrel protein [Verrucomicrobiota bacterium]